MDNNIRVFFIASEDYGRISNDLLRQIAVLRWGYDENKLDSWINALRNDPFGLTSFYVFAVKGEMDLRNSKDINIVGFAYFCQDENDENQWYYGDLVVHSKYRRKGIATKIIDVSMRELQERKALKLFTYIDKDNKSSILLHEKLSFHPNENQANINGFDKNDRIVYERIV